MKIKLTLYKSVILEAIKAETYLKGIIDKSADDKAIAVAYHETAGDEQVHERKLSRCIEGALAALKTRLSPYLDSSNSTAGHNIYSESQDDVIYLYLTVSNRFNQSMVEPIAKLCSKYIEDWSLFSWYGGIGDKNQTGFYQDLLAMDFRNITEAISKKSPVVVKIPYTSKIELSVGTGLTLYDGEEVKVTYELDEGAVDDIEILPLGACVAARRDLDCFVIRAIFPGYAKCVIYSKHDDANIRKEIDIVVFSHK